jgi:hypothetical protein
VRHTASAARSEGRPSSPMPRTAQSIVLWRLRKEKREMRGLARETFFGIGFGVEFEEELIALHPKLTVEALVDHAEGLYSQLIAEGWCPLPDGGGRSDER